MDAWPENQKRKPLVTVEFQTEVNIATGSRERRMFVKMYFEARDSGLLAAIPDELWKTLCCLATYIDENGYCYPSQSLLAKDLGISRQHTNKRIQRLLAFQFHGRPILTVSKNRENKQGGSRWANNVYQLRPITGFAIFDDQKSVISSDIEQTQTKSSVSPQGDIQLNRTSVSPSVSYDDDTREGDTNQTQELTRRLNVNDLEKSALEKGKEHQGVSDSEFHAALQHRMLIADILEICGDQHSRGFYTRVVQKLPAEVIRRALSETKYQAQTGKIRKSKGAFFTDEITRIAKTRGIDLRINSPGSETGRTRSPEKQ
jgi:hypothetical protein